MPSALPRHRSYFTVSGAYVCTYTHKLSLTATFSLSPPPPATPTVLARFHSAVNSPPPFAFPSSRCRSAPLPPTIARPPYQSHVPPTHRGSSRLHSKPSALTPPQAPMNARQSSPTLRQECDHYAYSEQPPAHGTEGSAHSLRQAHDKEPVAPQVTRHPSVLFTPSALHSFALHAYAPAVLLDRTSPHSAPCRD